MNLIDKINQKATEYVKKSEEKERQEKLKDFNIFRTFDMLSQVLIQKIIKNQEIGAIEYLRSQKTDIIYPLIDAAANRRERFDEITKIGNGLDIFEYIALKYYRVYSESERNYCFTIKKVIFETLTDIISEMNLKGLDTTKVHAVRNMMN